MQLEVGSILEGKITGITNFGAFVDLPGGVTGMVHISEVAPTYVSQIRDFLKIGQEVKVKVLSVGDDGKISLSIKKAMDKPQQSQRPAGIDNRSDAPRARDRRRQPTPPAPPVTSPGDFEWHAKRNDSANFEDMMSRFKQSSDEKISALKKGESTTRRRKPQK